jgi:hypothetical protein
MSKVMVSEKLVGSFKVVMRSAGERMDYHVRSQVDVLIIVLLHYSCDVVVNLLLDRVHVLIEKTPVEDLILGSFRQAFLGIPVESEFLVHSNIGLLILV